MIRWTEDGKTGTIKSLAGYTILVGVGGGASTLWRCGPDPKPLLRGTIEECQRLAEAIEAEPVELEYAPDTSDLAGLPGDVARLVALARRVGASGDRLKRICEERLPREIRALEMGILEGAARAMWDGVREGPA